MTRSLALVSTLVIAVFLGQFESAEAAIVVTKDGKVYVGAMKPLEDVLGDEIFIRWPHNKVKAPAEFAGKTRVSFARSKVRWFDPRNDTLTVKYWEKFRRHPIEKGYKPPENFGLISDPGLAAEKFVAEFHEDSKQTLSKVKDKVPGLEFFPPSDWDRFDHGEICILKAKKADKSGFTPRIHIIRCKRPKASSPEIVRNFLKQLKTLTDDRDFIESSQKSVFRSASLNEIEIDLTANVDEKLIKSKRYLFIQSKTVFMVSCYTTVDDYSKRIWLFNKFRKSIKINMGE